MKHDDGFIDLASGLTTKAYTFSPAASGVTYSFRVQSRNSVGYSNYSSTLEIIAATIPSSPVDLTRNYELMNLNQVAFTWSPPENDGSSSILGYSIE